MTALFHYAECLILFIIMLNVVMVSVRRPRQKIITKTQILSVVATQMDIIKTHAYKSFSITRVKMFIGLAPDFIYDE
jgi:hypothetical protein